ncbi:MAG TPA: hypothetical protein VFD43_00340, partial [Planctomycetota bacterium]|nr:hypothetical protein [Planctomycetota bacterium]
MKHPRIVTFALLVAGLASVAAGERPETAAGVIDSFGFEAGGSASGPWNLPIPSDGEDGFASGVLHLGESFPFYLMSAILPAEDVQGTGARSAGTLFGALHSFPLSPIGTSFVVMSGTWEASGPDGGTFQALIHTGSGGPLGLPTILLGSISGTFSDLVVSGGSGAPEVLGSWQGTWTQFAAP